MDGTEWWCFMTIDKTQRKRVKHETKQESWSGGGAAFGRLQTASWLMAVYMLSFPL